LALPPPRRAPPHAQASADRAACCRAPCRGTGSASGDAASARPSAAAAMKGMVMPAPAPWRQHITGPRAARRLQQAGDRAPSSSEIETGSGDS
jgi:hypothetical protein